MKLFLLHHYIYGYGDMLYTRSELVKTLCNYNLKNLLSNVFELYKMINKNDELEQLPFTFCEIKEISNVKTIQRKITQYRSGQDVEYLFNDNAVITPLKKRDYLNLKRETDQYADKMKMLRSDWNYLVQTNSLGKEVKPNLSDIISEIYWHPFGGFPKNLLASLWRFS